MDLVNNNNVSILSIIINVPHWYKVLIIEETGEGGEVENILELFVLYTQSFCKSKTTLKKQSLLIKKKT